MPVKPIPDGYHTVTAYITVDNAAAALDFYKKAFGAAELMRFPGPGGKIMHAEIKIGDSPVMLSDEFPEMGARSPKSIGGAASMLMVYVENVDKLTEQAIAAGAKVIRPVQNQFYGDRSATLEDPSGHRWTIATHIEDLSMEEMKKRGEAAMKEGAC